MSPARLALLAARQARQAMAWRLEAKVAATAQLTRAMFSHDPAVAAWSRQRALTLIEECRGLILQGGTA